ncbi:MULTISPECIES: hypothetical protein [Streptomyces]|uniref:hypothetical protein n=1 Tax=Streptomyces TaxID=1883 RepID=UPI00374DFC23
MAMCLTGGPPRTRSTPRNFGTIPGRLKRRARLRGPPVGDSGAAAQGRAPPDDRPGGRVPDRRDEPAARLGGHPAADPGGRTGGNRYLVIGLGTGQAADLAVPPDRNELIAYGPLPSDDGATWLGTAVLVRAPDPGTARAILTPDRYADIEVHNWQFGGRPS